MSIAQSTKLLIFWDSSLYPSCSKLQAKGGAALLTETDTKMNTGDLAHRTIVKTTQTITCLKWVGSRAAILPKAKPWKSLENE